MWNHIYYAHRYNKRQTKASNDQQHRIRQTSHLTSTNKQKNSSEFSTRILSLRFAFQGLNVEFLPFLPSRPHRNLVMFYRTLYATISRFIHHPTTQAGVIPWSVNSFAGASAATPPASGIAAVAVAVAGTVSPLPSVVSITAASSFFSSPLFFAHFGGL